MPVRWAFAIDTTAEGACVIEMLTGDIMLSKNADTKLPMASTTKIMTAIVAIETSDLDDVITVSRNAAYQEGSSAYLYEGFNVTMRDALYGLMLNSGNDAAVAIAEHIAGDCEKFADMMNEKAADIGVQNTHFITPNGLHDENHYTTAYDLALIARYAMQNEDFRKIVSSKSYSINVINTGDLREYFNHNRLLKEYDGCIGIKTGYTKDAGRCLVSAAERGGLCFIAVTLNCKNDWEEHKAMLDEAFSRYSVYKAAKAGDTVEYAEGNLIYGEDINIPVKNGAKRNVTITLHIPKVLTTAEKNEKIGYGEVFNNGIYIADVDICAKYPIQEDFSVSNTFKRHIMHMIKKLLI